ncbi:MAG: bifunctional 5,10-methylenetetrahydrofolate dehydrogenase/5,10-methenyltetrahydrofolate cyclohydrolase [Elusimicrobia bacterium]|nr:bifunctional 5,10-methylenetetrahydrofolate dehydrogenase/5,10-methenyltetrahydrofolate cyclohydrolase [Elusimicrobiota bacterium]
MTAVLDCRGLADGFFAWVRERRAELPYTPGVATLLLRGHTDAASTQYRDLILKDARSLGMMARSVEARDEAELLAALENLNADHEVQGIVIMYPLRARRPDHEVMDLVSPGKDIEGLHSVNLGYLLKFRRYLDESRGLKCVVPATAKAVLKALVSRPEAPIEGAFCTIVNNSMRVGKPLGLMLENLGATVVKCYDKTPREALEACVRRSDIVVTAVPGTAFRLDPSWVKPGAAVVDVSFEGNVDASALMGRAGLVTAPENRIGRLTRAMMFVNLIYCCAAASGVPESAGRGA